jgi:hypothetical protein
MREVGAPDPWAQQGEGTISAADAAINGVIDFIVDSIRGMPEVVKRLVEWFGLVIDKLFKPIRDIRRALEALPDVLLLAIAAVVALWVLGKVRK